MNRLVVAGLALLLGLPFAPESGIAQSPSSTSEAGLEFLPTGTSFLPLVAGYQEPRTGLRKEIGSSRMRLDIGTTLDLFAYRFSGPAVSDIRIGADLFAYGLTTSSEGLRLQVDAIDGLFGGHVVYRCEKDQTAFAVRLRILHHSAHFVDGHYDLNNEEWKGERSPNPYTRDFGELVLSHRWDFTQASLRIYGGVSYATLVRPEEVERWAGLAGIELNYELRGGGVLGQPFNLYIADNISVNGVPEYRTSNNLEGGMKFGPWNGTGVRLFVNYHAGLEPFGQYFDLYRKHWGIGFALDVL